MRALVQRVGRAAVRADGALVGEIGHGLLALLGVGHGDDEAGARWMAGKIARLRVFPGDDGRMRRSVGDVGGGVLVVSQFTLYGDVRGGNRPSFTAAAEPGTAERLVDLVGAELRALGVGVAEGRFGAAMTLDVVLDGPVTILIDGDA